MLRQFAGAVAVAAVFIGPGVAIARPTTFTLGGTYQLMETGQAAPPLDLTGLLSGRYADGPTVSVPFPASVVGMDFSVALGAERLVAQIQSTPGEKRAFGISQGAIAMAEAKRRLAALPADQRPAPASVTFVAVADPTRPGHGALAQLGYRTTDTPYDTVYVTREYDGFADLPDRFNVMAIVNAAAGIMYVHPYYGELPADIPARNITTTVNGAGGTETNVLIPNAHLPMLQPLRDLGVNVDGLEGVLKPMVDAGYSRNDARPTGAVTRAEKTEPEDEHEDEPTKVHRNVQASAAAHETTNERSPMVDAKGTDQRKSAAAVEPSAGEPTDAHDDAGPTSAGPTSAGPGGAEE